MTNIVISACTYKRPDGLTALFESFKTIIIPDDVSLSIRIIDNEPQPAAKDLVTTLSKEMPFKVFYVHEPNPGIAPARNRALLEAKDDDFLIFVDDDETVSAQWVKELWSVQNANNAHFVQGPVTLTVDAPKDEWMIKSKLFALKNFPDNAPRHEAWSNNVMIDMDFVRDNNLAFDPSLRFDGGEDTLFFQQMSEAGAKGVFAANAIVYENQPKSRLTWRWALRRQFRNGNTRAMIAYRMNTRTRAVFKTLIRAAGCAAFGIVILPLTVSLGRIGIANSATYWARAFGNLYGLFGGQYQEYARQSSPKEKQL